VNRAQTFALEIATAQRQVLEKDIGLNVGKADGMLLQKLRGCQLAGDDAVYDCPIFVYHKGKRMNFIYKVIGGQTDRLIGAIMGAVMDTFIGEGRGFCFENMQKCAQDQILVEVSTAA
jgi:hypothetical protein